MSGKTIGNVTATVTDPNGKETTVTGTSSDWTTQTIDLTKDGTWTVSIVDDDKYCAATTVEFTVNKADKFTKKFDKDLLYRVGHQNEFDIGYIFGEIETAVGLSTVNVKIDNVAGNAAGTFTSNATWTSGKIKFTGTGVVKVTISADCANSLVINLEVVEAKNYPSPTSGASLSATDNNVVLLNDVSANSINISNGYAFYGNGFKVKFNGDGSYGSASLSYGFVTVENGGILDNVQIICKVFPTSYIYTNQMTANSNGRYPYGYSAVVITGNSTISNSYIYGARNNIQVGVGNVTISNTVTESGSLSNIHIISDSNYTVTLDNVTTSQKLIQSDSSFSTQNNIFGFGVAVGTNESTSNANIKLTGNLVQHNWITKADADAMNNINGG